MSAHRTMQPALERGAGGGNRSGERLAIIGLLLLCVVWLLAVGCPFIQLDDLLYITHNPLVQEGFKPATIVGAFTSTRGAIWFPLTWISMELDSTLFGMGPMGFHLTNVLLHVANVVLLFVFLYRTTGSLWRSFAAAALWAVHPLRVESVAWASERKDVLSTFFGLLALLAYVRFVRTRSLRAYVGSIILLALSVFSKPMLVTFPFLLLVVDYWPLRRLSWRDLPALLVEKAAFLLPALAAMYMTMLVQGPHLIASPLSLRIESAVLSYALYLRGMVYFGGLAIWYPRLYRVETVHFVAAAIVLAVVTGWVVWMRTGPVLAGWLWFLGTLVPVLELVQSGEQARADRFTYIPAMGLGMMVIWAAPDGWVMQKIGRRAAAVILGGAVAACMVFTAGRLMLWHDPTALYEQGIARTQNNWYLEMALGDDAKERGDTAGAIAAYTRAVTIAPTLHEIQNNLGSMLAREGRLDLALDHFRLAYQTRPDNPLYAENYRRAQAMLATRRAPDSDSAPASHP